MRPRTILAVGAHIGDMDLAAGPILAENALAGGRSLLLALTSGERGHPRMGIAEYRRQKITETRSFAAHIGAEAIVFEDLSDGFLAAEDAVADRVAMLIRDTRPELLLAHWHRSMHSDHENASWIAERARYLAGLPGHREQDAPRHAVTAVKYTENWEDAPGFVADAFVEITGPARERWQQAIEGQAFARGETYGFRYIDYYAAQMITRGALAGRPYAVALASETYPYMEELA